MILTEEMVATIDVTRGKIQYASLRETEDIEKLFNSPNVRSQIFYAVLEHIGLTPSDFKPEELTHAERYYSIQLGEDVGLGATCILNYYVASLATNNGFIGKIKELSPENLKKIISSFGFKISTY